MENDSFFNEDFYEFGSYIPWAAFMLPIIYLTNEFSFFWYCLTVIQVLALFFQIYCFWMRWREKLSESFNKFTSWISRKVGLVKMKRYAIYFNVLFTSEDEEDILEEGMVIREYDPDLSPEEEFEEEFNDSCEDDYVEIPDWDNGFNSELTITKVEEIE